MSPLRLGAFFNAVSSDWLSLMTGPLSLVLLFTPLVLPKVTAEYLGGSTLVWVVAFIGLFVSSYRIWLTEHRARLAQRLEPLIEEAQQLLEFWDKIRYDDPDSQLLKFPLSGFDVESWEEVHKQLLRLYFWTDLQGRHAETCFSSLGMARPRLAEVIGDQSRRRAVTGIGYTKLIEDHLGLLEISRKRVGGHQNRPLKVTPAPPVSAN